MNQIATALLFDSDGKLLIYLRDNIPTIPFPNYWDLFGGHVEANETPYEALIRELEEELDVKPIAVEFYKTFEVHKGDSKPNTKHVFVVHIAESAGALTLYEGQELRAIALKEHPMFRFANVLGDIVADYANSHSCNEDAL